MPPNLVNLISYPPNSIIFLTLLAIMLNFIMAIVTKFTIDIEKLKKYSEQRKEFMRLKYELKLKGKKGELKIKKLESKMKSVEQELMMMQLKQSLITPLPMLLVFILLRRVYGSIPVASLPFKLPFSSFLHRGSPLSEYEVGFIGFYFIVSIAFSPIIQKALGTSPT